VKELPEVVEYVKVLKENDATPFIFIENKVIIDKQEFYIIYVGEQFINRRVRALTYYYEIHSHTLYKYDYLNDTLLFIKNAIIKIN
jgi:hypothetical protein